MLSFKALSEKKTKIKINPKMNDVMEGGFRATAESGMPITMHSYEKGGKVKKAKKVVSEKNHGEDCDCMKCEKKRRSEDVHDGPDVANEGYKGTMDLSKANPKAKKKVEDNIEKHFGKKRVPGGKMGVKEDLAQEGSAYGITKGSGKAGGAMKAYLDNKAKKLEAEKKKQRPEYRNNPAFGDPSHHSNAKNK